MDWLVLKNGGANRFLNKLLQSELRYIPLTDLGGYSPSLPCNLKEYEESMW